MAVWEEFRVQDVSHCPDLTLMRKKNKKIDNNASRESKWSNLTT